MRGLLRTGDAGAKGPYRNQARRPDVAELTAGVAIGMVVVAVIAIENRKNPVGGGVGPY